MEKNVPHYILLPDNITQEQFGDWNSPVAVLKAAELATKMRYECLEKNKILFLKQFFLPRKSCNL